MSKTRFVCSCVVDFNRLLHDFKIAHVWDTLVEAESLEEAVRDALNAYQSILMDSIALSAKCKCKTEEEAMKEFLEEYGDQLDELAKSLAKPLLSTAEMVEHLSSDLQALGQQIIEDLKKQGKPKAR